MNFKNENSDEGRDDGGGDSDEVGTYVCLSVTNM